MKTRMIKPLVVLSAVTAIASANAQEKPEPPKSTEAVAELRDRARTEAAKQSECDDDFPARREGIRDQCDRGREARERGPRVRRTR